MVEQLEPSVEAGSAGRDARRVVVGGGNMIDPRNGEAGEISELPCCQLFISSWRFQVCTQQASGGGNGPTHFRLDR